MAASEPGPNGAARWRPSLPTGLVVGATVVALLAVSGLIYLLYNRTRGPAEVLRDFAEAVDAADCEAAYDLLSESSRASIDQETFCASQMPSIDEDLSADFTLDRVVYHRTTQTADLTVTSPESGPWRLERHGNTWRLVLEPAG